MDWLKDRAWQQSLATVLVLTGTVLIYPGAATSGVLNGTAVTGAVLFGLGVAAPLVAQMFRAYRESTARNEDV